MFVEVPNALVADPVPKMDLVVLGAEKILFVMFTVVPVVDDEVPNVKAVLAKEIPVAGPLLGTEAPNSDDVFTGTEVFEGKPNIDCVVLGTTVLLAAEPNIDDLAEVGTTLTLVADWPKIDELLFGAALVDFSPVEVPKIDPV